MGVVWMIVTGPGGRGESGGGGERGHSAGSMHLQIVCSRLFRKAQIVAEHHLTFLIFFTPNVVTESVPVNRRKISILFEA